MLRRRRRVCAWGKLTADQTDYADGSGSHSCTCDFPQGLKPSSHLGFNAGPKACSTLFLEQIAGDHQALDLAGTFADGAKLHVAIKLFRRIVLDEAVAAV